MPARKAAKKASRKSASEAHHIRRAYEHLGRIEILEGALAGSSFRDVAALATLAEQQLLSGKAREAAHLLRAAEHLTFAALAPHSTTHASDTRVSPDLRAAIAAEFEHLIDSARRHQEEAHWSPPSAPPKTPSNTRRNTPRSAGSLTLSALYARTLEHAQSAYAAAAYGPALELARASEAIGRVSSDGLISLQASDRLIQLLAS
jgi:hypothetical protein